MAGVAGPRLRDDRSAGLRFLLGLTVGGAVAGLLLSLPIFLIGNAATAVLSHEVRLGLVVALALGFGILDFTGRTPHVWRQVPQRFWHTIAPGRLGLVWGADLGLLVTTQKTTSLLWLSIAAVALLKPGLAPAVMVALSLITAGAVVFLTGVGAWKTMVRGGMGWKWIAHARKLSGGAMVIVGVATVLSRTLN
jgi:hypothetical protein